MDHYPELMAGVVCVIVDEAHQAKAKTIGEIMTGPASNAPFRFGCTGTVPKEDLARHQIFGAIGPILFTLTSWELQQQGVLASSQVYQITLKDSRNPRYRMASAFDDWSEQLAWQFADPERFATMVAIIQDLVETEGNTLVFVPHKEHGKMLANAIAGSVSLDGDDKAHKRRKHYEWFNANDGNVLICTYGIASTGLDIPRIKVLCFIEPGKKFEKIIQSIGRGLRKAEDKDHVTIMDIASDTDFSKKHAASRRKLYKDANIPCITEDYDYANS
jgi:superfamily II DNA or RNA helicase